MSAKTAEQADALKRIGRTRTAAPTESDTLLNVNVGPTKASANLATVLCSAPVGLSGSLKSIRLGGQSSSGRFIVADTIDSEAKRDGNHHHQPSSFPTPRGSAGATASNYNIGNSHQGDPSGDVGNSDSLPGSGQQCSGDSSPAPALARHSSSPMSPMARPLGSEPMLFRARSGRKISVVLPASPTSTPGGVMSPQPPSSDSDPWSLGALALPGEAADP